MQFSTLQQEKYGPPRDALSSVCQPEGILPSTRRPKKNKFISCGVVVGAVQSAISPGVITVNDGKRALSLGHSSTTTSGGEGGGRLVNEAN